MGTEKQRIMHCRYCGETLLSDRNTCPNCGSRKQPPVFLLAEFWGILAAIALAGFAFATALAG